MERPLTPTRIPAPPTPVRTAAPVVDRPGDGRTDVATIAYPVRNHVAEEAPINPHRNQTAGS